MVIYLACGLDLAMTISTHFFVANREEVFFHPPKPVTLYLIKQKEEKILCLFLSRCPFIPSTSLLLLLLTRSPCPSVPLTIP